MLTGNDPESQTRFFARKADEVVCQGIQGVQRVFCAELRLYGAVVAFKLFHFRPFLVRQGFLFGAPPTLRLEFASSTTSECSGLDAVAADGISQEEASS